MTLKPGQTISHFEILGPIGAGGMGEVYRARDTRLSREVALKVLPSELASEPEYLERFEREARTLAALNHPNIATIHGIEQDGDIHCLTLELVPGNGLDEFLREGPLPIPEALDVCRQIAVALQAAHDAGIVHRDLKPANVRRTPEGVVKVLDFGIAKRFQLDADADTSADEAPLTRAGAAIGTPPYMSPEQARGLHVDHRSDIWSFGCVLYECLTGERPFRGPTMADLLAAILGAEPDWDRLPADTPARVRELLRQCLAKEATDRPPDLSDAASLAADSLGEQSAVPPPARERRPLVGRSAEKHILDAALTQARSGRGALMLIGGEPGVGKTRLAQEVLEDAAESGFLAVSGHAYEDEAAPFITASEILEDMVRIVAPDDLRRMLGDNASELARLLPELRRLFHDVPEPIDMPPELQQRHLFKGVLEFLTRASRERPMVILLDDLHWADESSLALVEFIAPHLAKTPIFMVATYRDVQADMSDGFARLMATLVRQRLAERIQVKEFDCAAVGELLAVLGGSEPPPGLPEAIHEATEGNVFFVEETFRHLEEEGLLFDAEDDWRAELDVASLDVPEGVRLVTARRIERLTEPTQQVLGIAAVMGLRFSTQALEAAAADADVLDALEEAEAAQLVRPAVVGREPRYEFVHALARLTLSSSFSPLRRQRMHLTIADALEHVDTRQPERRAADIAHHLVEAAGAADTRRTARWLEEAGGHAVAAAAMEEATRYFDMALDLTGDEAEARADLMHRRGSARLSLGHRDEFVADLSSAFDGFEALGLGERAAAVVFELSYMLIWNGRLDEAQALIARALAFVGEGQTAARCQLLSAQGLAHGMGSEPAEAARAHEAAVGMARTLDSDVLLAEALQNQAADQWHRFDAVNVHASAHEAASIRRELNHEWNLGQCLWLQQAGLVCQGRFAEGERINSELLALAERNDDVGSLAVCATMNGVIEQARGNLTGSSRHMCRSIELFDAGNFPWGWISEGHYSVNALLAGDYERARTAFELAGEHALSGLVWSGAASGYRLSGKARLGDQDTYSLFESLRPQLPRQGEPKPAGAVMLLMGAIEALMLIGKKDDAAALYPAMRDVVADCSLLNSSAYGLHERFTGMAAAAARDWDTAEAHYGRALELAETLPQRVDQARVRYWWARMLVDRDESGDRDRAAQMCTEAREVCEELGLHGLIEQIDEAGRGLAAL